MEGHAKHTTIVGVEEHRGSHLIVYREVAGFDVLSPTLMPKQTLAIRAAEYDLDIEDPMALDILLLEGFYDEVPNAVTDDIHPLFTSKTVADAFIVISNRVEEVRVDRDAPPEETGNRMMANAVINKAASKGLVRTRDALLLHASKAKDTYDRARDNRDELRESIKNTGTWNTSQIIIPRPERKMPLKYMPK